MIFDGDDDRPRGPGDASAPRAVSPALLELLQLSRGEATEAIRLARVARRRRDDRARARESFRWFVEAAWPHVEPRAFIGGKHIDALCEFLQDYFDTGGGELAVINVPPATGKSLICTVLWPAWIWAARDAGHRFIATSYADTACRRDAIRCRNLVLSEWWAARWPEITIPYQNTHAAQDWSTSTGGWRISVSLGGQLTSRHADTILIDDPIKPEDARLERSALEETNRLIAETLPTRRINPGSSHVLIVMQRLHQEDPAGVALRAGARRLILPMRFNPEKADPRDWRTEPGELLWPEGKPERDVVTLEVGPTALTPYAQRGQLDQDPDAEGGGVFKLDKLRYYKLLPYGADKYGTWCFALDAKMKTTTTGAFACIAVWCLFEARMYLVDRWRERAGLAATKAAFRSLSTQYPHVLAKVIEDAALGATVAEDLAGELMGIQLVGTGGGPEARAHVFAARVETGDVYLPEDNPITLELKAEMSPFPAGRTRDFVDASAHAVNYLASHVVPSVLPGLTALAGGLGLSRRR